MLTVLNPATEEPIAELEQAGVEETDALVARAKAAFPAWRDTPAEQRAALLRRVADVLRRRRFELAAVEVFETGKPWREADADVAEAIDFCDYYAVEAEKL